MLTLLLVGMFCLKLLSETTNKHTYSLFAFSSFCKRIMENISKNNSIDSFFSVCVANPVPKFSAPLFLLSLQIGRDNKFSRVLMTKLYRLCVNWNTKPLLCLNIIHSLQLFISHNTSFSKIITSQLHFIIMWLRFFRDKTAAVQTICLLRVVRTLRQRHEIFYIVRSNRFVITNA